MKIRIILLCLLAGKFSTGNSMPCTPLGDETSYGSGNVWIGYVYDNINFTGYSGYVDEGAAASPNFDESFGGDNANYLTNGCPVYTETFSVRYKLSKTFADGYYELVVGGDDGFRLSLDGGSTWVINNWNDQAYTVISTSIHLNGTYNMVLEYYENGGGNRVSFSVLNSCIGLDNESVYGTGNIWKGYVYDGTNFNTYKGLVQEGSVSSADFDESFGGSNSMYATNSCSMLTETFSARYRLTKSFANGSYIFIVGGDDGYRLSLDGGATWVINSWGDQSYNVSSYSGIVSGSHDMVLEYYENGGDNRISFSISGAVLPVNLLSFQGEKTDQGVSLDWNISHNSTIDHFEIERKDDNNQFNTIGTAAAAQGIVAQDGIRFNYIDKNPVDNISDYRLKIVDLSGVSTYSTIVTIRTLASENTIAVYPTITSGTVYIRPTQNILQPQITLYDLNGKLLVEKRSAAWSAGIAYPLSFSNSIPKGIYLLTVSGDHAERFTKKIFIR